MGEMDRHKRHIRKTEIKHAYGWIESKVVYTDKKKNHSIIDKIMEYLCIFLVTEKDMMD